MSETERGVESRSLVVDGEVITNSEDVVVGGAVDLEGVGSGGGPLSRGHLYLGDVAGDSDSSIRLCLLVEATLGTSSNSDLLDGGGTVGHVVGRSDLELGLTGVLDDGAVDVHGGEGSKRHD
jgi:hypothetical protein